MSDPTKSRHAYYVLFDRDQGEPVNFVTTRSCKYAGVMARAFADAGYKNVRIEVTLGLPDDIEVSVAGPVKEIFPSEGVPKNVRVRVTAK
jgi:hypothetical protein